MLKYEQSYLFAARATVYFLLTRSKMEDEVDIVLIVSGRRFELKMATLKRIPYLYNMLKDCVSDRREITVWRSPMLFEHVLALAYDESYLLPDEARREANFYFMTYDESRPTLETKLQHIMFAVNDVRVDMMKNLQCVKYECAENAMELSLLCQKHQKKCISPKCIIEPTESNFCKQHSNSLSCRKKSCRGQKLHGFDLCAMHANDARFK
jgi:hypothetical protein